MDSVVYYRLKNLPDFIYRYEECGINPALGMSLEFPQTIFRVHFPNGDGIERSLAVGAIGMDYSFVNNKEYVFYDLYNFTQLPLGDICIDDISEVIGYEDKLVADGCFETKQFNKSRVLAKDNIQSLVNGGNQYPLSSNVHVRVFNTWITLVIDVDKHGFKFQNDYQLSPDMTGNEAARLAVDLNKINQFCGMTDYGYIFEDIFRGLLKFYSFGKLKWYSNSTFYNELRCIVIEHYRPIYNNLVKNKGVIDVSGESELDLMYEIQ